MFPSFPGHKIISIEKANKYMEKLNYTKEKIDVIIADGKILDQRKEM